MKIALIATVSIALASLLVGCSGGKPEAQMLQARLVPWTNPNGIAMQQVLVDWKNTGNATAKVVNADIKIRDASGNEVESSPGKYCIYANSTGIAPGQTYSEPIGDGYVVIPAPGEAPAATVEVTNLEAKAEMAQ